MAYQALYRTYRPTDFSEMAGQKHILRTLHNAVTLRKIAHAYLFTGPRGTGKTSVARILAKSVNCTGIDTKQFPCNTCENCIAIQKGIHPDIIEIDAASNNGVDEVRDLIDKVKYSPITGKYKVYIIDEVHMMSTGAFNALLKTLEEPPSHVIFILATTEPHKILATIISRCQRYDFTKIADADIEQVIRKVIASEQVTCDDETIRLISSLADGGMRDALSILDQCIAYAGNSITITTIHEIYGITTVEEIIQLLQRVENRDTKNLLEQLYAFLTKGIDVKRLCTSIIEVLKESIIYQLTKSESLLVLLKPQEVKLLADLFDSNRLFQMIDILMDSQEKFKYASNIGSYFELALLKLIAYEPQEMMEIKEVRRTKQVEPQQNRSTLQRVLPKTMHEEKISIEQEAKKEISLPNSVVAKQAAKEVSMDEVINLLVQGSVDDRKNAAAVWNQLSNYFMNDTFRTVSKWLTDGSIVASNEEFILFATKHQLQANMINDQIHQDTILKLMVELFQKPRLVVAISEQKRMQAIETFLDLRSRNVLPSPMKVEVPFVVVPETIAVVDSVEGKLKSICGDLLEIIEE